MPSLVISIFYMLVSHGHWLQDWRKWFRQQRWDVIADSLTSHTKITFQMLRYGTESQTAWRSYDHSEETKSKMVWACHRIHRTCQNNATIVQRKRKRGRQRKRWEDNITEWTGKTVSDNLREAEDRENGESWLPRCSGAPTVAPTTG